MARTRTFTNLGDPVHAGQRPRGLRYTPITDYDPLRDVNILMGLEAERWKSIDRGIDGPTALVGGLAGIESGTEVMLADDAAVTGGTVNVALWDSRIRTPIGPMVRKGTLYELSAEGTVTSSAASQTLILNPHIGASNTVGTNLTASPTQTLGSTITLAIWRLWGELTVRTVGAGTAATAVGAFRFEYTTVANGGAPTTVIWRSSGGAATFDSTALNGLVMGATPSAVGVSLVTRQIRWGSWG